MEQKVEITNLQELIDWIDNSKICYVTETSEIYFVIQAPNNATWQIQFEKKDNIEDIIYKAKEQLEQFDADEQFADWWHKDFEYPPLQFITMLKEDEASFKELARELRKLTN